MSPILRLIAGTNSKTRRVLKYWAGVTLLYFFYCGLVLHQVTVGVVSIFDGSLVIGLAATGSAVFYLVLRGNEALGLKNWRLTFAQAVFAVICDLALYVVLEPVRGGVLIALPLTILLCAFSLRPHQIRWLSAFGISALACVVIVLYQLRPLTHPGYVEVAHFLQATIGITAVTFVTGKLNILQSSLRQQNEDLERSTATIRTLASTDELTQLSSRRHMKELLTFEESRTTPQSSTICVAILDVDYFKIINDTYGHSAGDVVLRSFAAAAKATLRSMDVMARWGGEEFLLLMPGTNIGDAVTLLERIASCVSEMCLTEVAPQLKITFSAGVVARANLESLADAIRRADRAMYSAKNSGRNRIMTG